MNLEEDPPSFLIEAQQGFPSIQKAAERLGGVLAAAQVGDDPAFRHQVLSHPKTDSRLAAFDVSTLLMCASTPSQREQRKNREPAPPTHRARTDLSVDRSSFHTCGASPDRTRPLRERALPQKWPPARSVAGQLEV